MADEYGDDDFEDYDDEFEDDAEEEAPTAADAQKVIAEADSEMRARLAEARAQNPLGLLKLRVAGASSHQVLNAVCMAPGAPAADVVGSLRAFSIFCVAFEKSIVRRHRSFSPSRSFAASVMAAGRALGQLPPAALRTRRNGFRQFHSQ